MESFPDSSIDGGEVASYLPDARSITAEFLRIASQYRLEYIAPEGELSPSVSGESLLMAIKRRWELESDHLPSTLHPFPPLRSDWSDENAIYQLQELLYPIVPRTPGESHILAFHGTNVRRG